MKTSFTQEDIALVKRILDATTMKVFANTQPRLHSTESDDDTIVVDGMYITLETRYESLTDVWGDYADERGYNTYRLSAEVTIPSNSRMEPDDVDIKDLHTATELVEAVRLLVMEVCWHMIDSAMEADAMAAAYAAEY